MVSDQEPVNPQAVTPVPGSVYTYTAPVPKRSRMLIVIVAVAAVAVVLIAVVLASGIGQAGGQVIKNGDHIKWRISGIVGSEAVDGEVTLTFSEVTSSTCRMSYVSTTPFYQNNAGVYLFKTTNGVWTSNGLTGVALDDPSYFKERMVLETMYGNKTVSNYQFPYQGTTISYYIVDGSGIPYLINISGTNGYLVMSLTETNVDWIKNL